MANRFSLLNALVVDDDEVQRVIMSQILKNLGVRHVAAVRNAEDALAHLRQHLVHVVFTDYEMPGMDGLLLAAEIGQGRLTRHIPVVMVTSINTHELRATLRERPLGAPVSPPHSCGVCFLLTVQCEQYLMN